MGYALNDFQCEDCQIIEEHLVERSIEIVPCRRCSGTAHRVISTSGVNCANEDAEWIRSVREVVDKDSTKLHVREFLHNPTRENYKKWMKGEGLRHLEDGEKHQKPGLDTKRHAEKIMELRYNRRRIEL
jgi:hypothetical protein